MAEYTEARKRANKKWDESNRTRVNYINKRSTARNFIKKSATARDLVELQELITERQQLLDEAEAKN